MLLLIFIGFLVYWNVRMAKARGKNVFLYGLLTVVSMFVAYMIGMFLIVRLFYPEYLNTNDFNKSQELASMITNNGLQSFFIIFCGLGGYLLVRYLLERSKPNT